MSPEIAMVETVEWDNPKHYGLYMDGKPSEALVELFVRYLPCKVTLPCGNFRWFSDLHYTMFSDIPCNCGAPYEHYFIKWRRQ